MASLVLFAFEMTSRLISDRGKLLACFNSKKILLFARLLFALGSALTGAAPSMNAFIVGKTITGVGSSGSYISIINIIAAFTSPLEKGRYFGYIGFVWGLGTMLVANPCSYCFSLNRYSDSDPVLEAPLPSLLRGGVGASTLI